MTLACEDAYSKLVEVVTVAEVSDEDHVGNNLLQIWKLRYGCKGKLLFKLLTKHCAQSLDKNLILSPNFSFQICTKLSSTLFSASTTATATTSTSFELASSHAKVTSIKFTKQE